MKQLARYRIHIEGKAITASYVWMGMAFFCQMISFFVFGHPQSIPIRDYILFLILPSLLEIGWVILLRFMRWNAAGILMMVGAAFSLLLMVQNCFSGGTGYIALSVLGYLVAIGGSFMIIGGYFPYKYFGAAYFALLFVIRFFHSGVLSLVRYRDWSEFCDTMPGLCILIAMALFFCGIEGIRYKK